LMVAECNQSEETDVERDPAAQTSRAEAIELLSRYCRRLLLQPSHDDTRHMFAVVLATTPLALGECDSLLITALVKEARAHVEELAYRLEAPGYSSLYIAATTARLHQTLTVLQKQLAPHVVEAFGQPVAA
jgi:hypothetical protein